MKLNRNNYEEFFVLYLDNELDSESRREVEAFAEANPDLKAELDMLLQSKLTPDTAISFSDKDSLMRFHNSTISLANYEEWLIAYIDNELSPEERKDAENFIAGNPSIQRELNLLQQVKLQPEAIVFPYKESLYRREEKARVISISWRRIAAAAVLLLAISTTAIVLIKNNNKSNSGNGPVALTPPEKKSDNNTANNQPKTTTPSVNPQATDDSGQKKIQSKQKDQNDLIANKENNKIKPEEKKEQIEPVKNEVATTIPKINEEKKPDSDLAAVKNSKTEIDNATISTGVNDHSLTDPKEKSATTDVTTNTPGTYHKSDEPDKVIENSDVRFASNNSSNGQKGGVRGFLRKVTRTFEKRTNIKATDDDDRLLIAGLAIKL